MALLMVDSDGNYLSTCAICNQPLEEPVFATTHFVGDPDHPFYPYSDAGMHWHCYANWPHRKQFARLHFVTQIKSGRQNPYWSVAHLDSLVLVTINPAPHIKEIDVELAETGSSFRVVMQDWKEWLNRTWVDDCRHEIEREALSVIIPTLRSRLPTAKAVARAANVKGDNLLQRIRNLLIS